MVKKNDKVSKNYKGMSYTQKKNSGYSNSKTQKKEETSKKTTSSKPKKEKNLEATTRIRIDNERLNDIDSLDTSFLEGRLTTKKANKIIASDVKLTNKNNRKRNTRRSIGKKTKADKTLVISVFIIVVIGVLITFAAFSLVNLITGSVKTKTVVKTETVTKKVVKNVVDENIVFLGDSITYMYDLQDSFEGHNVINSGTDGASTKDVLEKMDEKVYIYNPSKVFILIGTNDFDEERHGKFDEDTTINNIKSIIEGIKENRRFAEIYIESVYPINNSDGEIIQPTMVKNRNNDNIKKLNVRIKKLAKEEDIEYINMYDKLVDEDGLLNYDYTRDGLHINSVGYEVITEVLNKYI